MKRVELYGRVRHAVMIEGLSQREAARCFGIDPRTVRKMLSYSVPPGYVRTRPPVRPKLDPFIGIIDRILEEDKDRPKKQRHTSKRIFERLRDEYGFTGKITIVKDYICGVRQRRREMFVPLTHPPGHAQVDFGEALAVIGGVERKIHFLAMSLPHSDACFVKAYPGETTEAFCDGHVSGFSFFGGVPRSILYDNTRIAVARILGDGKRQRTRVFSELRSHYTEDRRAEPGTPICNAPWDHDRLLQGGRRGSWLGRCRCLRNDSNDLDGGEEASSSRRPTGTSAWRQRQDGDVGDRCLGTSVRFFMRFDDHRPGMATPGSTAAPISGRAAMADSHRACQLSRHRLRAPGCRTRPKPRPRCAGRGARGRSSCAQGDASDGRLHRHQQAALVSIAGFGPRDALPGGCRTCGEVMA